MWRWTWLASLILLSGCGVTGAVDCSAWRPILTHTPPRDMPRAQAAEAGFDVLTDETVRALLAHNETGRRLCGWG
ncbi:hypothetical protein EOD42_16950 [Rhodovarius crocodyli]|uniref:Uncharacterized protein n=1 Tax=Rhodovarius crocodyli TaxID=1979269 RepID=A0A437MCA2_9PROT|nr:hypothetical protein EOD42_16950 [Rhodovarius crocodyli]